MKLLPCNLLLDTGSAYKHTEKIKQAVQSCACIDSQKKKIIWFSDTIMLQNGKYFALGTDGLFLLYTGTLFNTEIQHSLITYVFIKDVSNILRRHLHRI